MDIPFLITKSILFLNNTHNPSGCLAINKKNGLCEVENFRNYSTDEKEILGILCTITNA